MTKKKKGTKKKPLNTQKPLELKPTDKLNGLKNFKELGKGKSGFTTIYSASKKDRTNVALKLFTLSTGNQYDQTLRYEKFKNEPLILNKLEHINIIKADCDEVTKVATLNGKKTNIDYFTMELLEGSLTGYMEDLQAMQTKWNLESKFNVLIQICDALEHAHLEEVYHRDLYTDNVLLVSFSEPLYAKVADFGAAKTPSLSSEMQYYHPMGARTVSSPEILVGLARDKETLVKSDVFSLGLLIFSVITEAPHDLESLLLHINIPTLDWTEKAREDYLKSGVIVYLANATRQIDIIVGSIKNSVEIETGLTSIVSNALRLDFRDRTSNVSIVRGELERLRSLINA